MSISYKHTVVLGLTLVIWCLNLKPIAGQSDIKGQIETAEGPVVYANVILYQVSDSSLYKVESTDLDGVFNLRGIAYGEYNLVCSYVGYEDLTLPLSVSSRELDLGSLAMQSQSVELQTAVVTARRAMVEVKPDRTVFNVQGTINSAGENGLNLLRKAPGVLIDNNNNVSVLSRSGVLFYVDGKRLPLSGDDLTVYLENLPAEQIDRIDIITNPGARYEAEGNAGIIDIRLKKDKSLGYNGSISSTYSQGQEAKWNSNLSGNYRNAILNAFGTVGLSDGTSLSEIYFDGYQNGFRLLGETINVSDRKGINYRLGTDFFVAKNHTVGFLISGNTSDESNISTNDNKISSFTDVTSFDTTPSDVEIPFDQIDSILIAQNLGDVDRIANTYNLNYTYSNNNVLLNVDLDYGAYRNTATESQPNTYLDREENILRTTNFFFDTPRDIDIWSGKLDYETSLLRGKLGLGGKYSSINTDNSFLFFDIPVPNQNIRNDEKSNLFAYSERVTALYTSYGQQLSEKWSLTSGIRLEHTDSEGTLTAFKEELQEDPVEQNYWSLFPNAGLTYQPTRGNTWSVNYGRRINRPDYNVLNPFRQQVTELDFFNGNPALRPEIVNNFELGYTYKYRFNFKLAYSLTKDKITRLIGTDDSDPKASFINWDNLTEQQVYSLNISTPFQIKSWWSAYFNTSVNYQKNLADYGFATIDLGVWGYNIFQQQTFTLGKGYVGELSGWYSGPGVWGGVFQYENSWALNVGLQKKLCKDKLNVRVSFNDVFNTAFWRGFSEFDGLLSYGQGFWDNQRASLSITYNFGNQEVKSRKRNTGIEKETKRANESDR